MTDGLAKTFFFLLERRADILQSLEEMADRLGKRTGNDITKMVMDAIKQANLIIQVDYIKSETQKWIKKNSECF